PVPFSISHLFVRLVQFIEKGQKHSQGVLPYRIPVSLRSSGQKDSQLLGVIGIYIFQTGTQAPNKLKVDGLIQKGLIQSKPASNDDTIIIRYFLFNFLLGGGIIFIILKPQGIKLFNDQWMVYI